MNLSIRILLFFATLTCWCATLAAQPIDKSASPEAVQLLNNLKLVAKQHVLFGHQNTLAYGYSWIGEPSRSDVRDVTGAYPSVYGWDFNAFSKEPADPHYGITEEKVLGWVREGAARHGVVTFSWHADNPVSHNGPWDKTPAVAAILPGGKKHADFCARLDELASFFHAAAPVSIIFRPFHEHNGDWFWWGKGNCSEEDYQAMWRFTVEYLRDQKNVHNLLYAFSPDRSRMRPDSESDYLYGYPGDDYIDILGLDNYFDLRSKWNKSPIEKKRSDFISSLELIVRLAEERNKLPALTETGISNEENVPNWWMEHLLAGINANDRTRQIAYVLVWRNANKKAERQDHFHTPYAGHPHVDDFRAFKNSDLIMFEDELPDWFKVLK